MISIKAAIIASLLSGAIIFLERFFPFALFSKKNPPKILSFIERYLPAMVIAVLIVYCLKDIQFTSAPFGAPYFIAIAVTIVLHLWLKNSMVSIFGSTIVFMILSRIM